MKSKSQRDAARDTLSREVGYVRKPHAGRLRVALAFPNTYFVGMSNLGFQTIYRLFNDQPDIVCERVFLPPKQELKSLLESGARIVSIESQTPIHDFDVFAFSVSFEWDYTNVLTLLRLAGLPVRAADRTPRPPARRDRRRRDVRQPRAARALCRRHRRRRRRGARAAARRPRCRQSDLARRPAARAGAAARLLHPVVLRRRVRRRRHASRATSRRPAPARRRSSARRRIKTTEAVDPPSTSIFTPDTEFGSRFLIEVVRGCANLCRFCWAGYNYLPVRAFPTERILELARAARAALVDAPAWCRSRSAITRTSSTSCAA